MAEMISFEEALATVDRVLGERQVETESVSVHEAHGRVLAEAPASKLDLPPFDKSAMDGYAVMADDVRDQYRVLEFVPAGKSPSRPLAAGAASKVMTGAPVPNGAARVIMVEDTDGGNDVVRVHKHSDRPNICKKAEDVHVGQGILACGTKLDSLGVANLIACGIATVRVRRSVRLAIITTGDEIVERVEDITPGKIMNSNGPLLRGLAKENHLEVAFQRIVSDDAAALAGAIDAAAAAADLILFSGGVSAGDLDLVPDCLKAAGFTIHFDRVAIKPGKPLTFATRRDAVVFGLPGNPVSVFSSFHLFVRRAVAILSARRPPDGYFMAPLGRAVRQKRADRTAFLPAALDADGRVQPQDFHGSAHLLALSSADGLLRIGQGVHEISEGHAVAFHPIRPVN